MLSKTKKRRLCGGLVTVAAATAWPERFPTLLFGFCGSMGCHICEHHLRNACDSSRPLVGECGILIFVVCYVSLTYVC